jgi:alpha-galactosidase
VAAPLIFSGDMTRLDEFTLSLLTNDEVIDVDQDPLGKPGRRLTKTGETEVWLKEMEDGSKSVGLFNRGDASTVVKADWSDLGISGGQTVRDLWRQKDLGVHRGFYQAEVPRHGVFLVSLRRSSP